MLPRILCVICLRQNPVQTEPNHFSTSSVCRERKNASQEHTTRGGWCALHYVELIFELYDSMLRILCSQERNRFSSVHWGYICACFRLERMRAVAGPLLPAYGVNGLAV